MKRLPAEWEAQAVTQFTFPHQDSDWASTFDEAVNCVSRCIEAVLEFQPVLVVCQHIPTVKNYLASLDSSKIDYIELPSNDTWARDHGGITVEENGQLTVLDFQFNGWGLKYAAHFDNLLTIRLWAANKFQNAKISTKNFVLEGGSIESDGAGTLLTTSECLLSPNRNPAYTKKDIEEQLRHFFGVKRVLWLDHGALEGDDTDAHIDTLARFCDEQTIAYVQCTDEQDSHFEAFQNMEQQLQQFRTMDGQPYRLIPLPLPDAIYGTNGERLPATYANFLFVNGGVLVPTYGVPQDEEALFTFQNLFPDRKVVGVDCRALIVQHGSLHCMTMQYPKGIQNSNRMTNFEERLKGGHPNSLGNTLAIVEEVLATPALFDELFHCYYSDDAVVRLRVSNATKRIAKANKQLVLPYLDRILEDVSLIDQASSKWTLAQLFKLLQKDLTTAQHAKAQSILQHNLSTTNDWIVLNMTMETLGGWAVKKESLKDWLLPHLQRLSLDGRTSVMKKADKWLAKLESN